MEDVGAGFVRAIIGKVFSEAGILAGLAVLLNVYQFIIIARLRRQLDDNAKTSREDAVANVKQYEQFVATAERLLAARQRR